MLDFGGRPGAWVPWVPVPSLGGSALPIPVGGGAPRFPEQRVEKVERDRERVERAG